MTRIEIRRMVIACDAAADLRRAVSEAALLAAEWRAELVGLYVEDENLYRLAELDIVRHVGFSAATFELSAAEMLKSMLPGYAGTMRAALETAALQHGLVWSFDTRRTVPSVEIFRELECDMLILDAESRPFSGDWRPRSAWPAIALAAARTVLLKRRRAGGRGTVIVAPRGKADYERLLATAFALAGARDEIVILSADPEIRELADRIAADRDRGYRLETMPATIDAMLARIDEIDPALLVLSADDETNTLRTLAEGTRCDLLLVR
jgi:hypothetical protein